MTKTALSIMSFSRERAAAPSDRKALRVAPEIPLSEAVALMARHRIHHLVVANGETLVGILSHRGILDAQLDRYFPSLRDLKVSDALEEGIPVVDSDFDLQQGLRVVLDQGHSAVLVRDHEGNATIVTEMDLLHALGSLVRRRSSLERLKDNFETILAKPLVQSISMLLAETGI